MPNYFQILTVVVYLCWMAWWWITAPKQDPSHKRKRTLFYLISKYTNFGLSVLIVFQLLGLTIFPIYHASSLHDMIGFCIFLSGILMSSVARVTLSVSWTPGYNYQIKPNQPLVTHGIFQYIRHPIYMGILLTYVGAELVSRSYLSIALLGLLVPVYQQSKKEEKILLAHFGEKYKKYMKRTKMLIPFVI